MRKLEMKIRRLLEVATYLKADINTRLRGTMSIISPESSFQLVR